MNLLNDMSSIEETSDAELVAACLGGDRAAYGQIVERYQRLLCSVAYSALGSFAASEDAAQEAFIEGWSKLGTLRDPSRLRSWLCGILRFKVSRHRRGDAREPTRLAESVDEMCEMDSGYEPVEEQTMRGEEEELLWQALEQVPELYREPLVLYYREHRSVEHVAYELDLTESTIKQRLSRGRKMLQEQMMSFVENTLTRSTPGRVFTLGVLAALPGMVPTAKAAGVGAVAVKTGMVVKSAGILAAIASVSGFVSSFFAIRANLDQSRTPLERREVVKTAAKFIGISVLFCVGLFGLRLAASHWYEYRSFFAVANVVGVLAFVVFMPVATYRILRGTRLLRSAERLRNPAAFSDERDRKGSAAGEYRSRATLFGVPLVHIKFSVSDEGDPPVFGWIAAGDRAYGLLFAWGGFAVAPVSVGIISMGIVSCGVVSFGALGVGTVGIGLVAFGAIAIGVNVLGSLSALGWDAATSGGFAIAREAAVGPIAFGKHANDEVAWELVNAGFPIQGHLFLLGLISVLVMVPVVLYARAVRRRFAKKVGK